MDVTVCHPQPAGAGAWPRQERGDRRPGAAAERGERRDTRGSQPVSGLECGAHEAVDMNHLDPGGLITVRLSVSDLSRAALRDDHMNHIVQKHLRGHLCLPVPLTPTSWRPAIFAG